MILPGNPYRAILRRDYPDPFIALLAFILGIWLWDHYFGKSAGYPPGTEEIALVKIDRDLRLADAMEKDPPWLHWIAGVETPAGAREEALAALGELGKEKAISLRGLEAFAVIRAVHQGAPARQALQNSIEGQAPASPEVLADRLSSGEATWWEVAQLAEVATAPPRVDDGKRRWHAENERLRLRTLSARGVVWLVGALGMFFLPGALGRLRRTFPSRTRGYAASWPLPLGLVVFMGATLAWIGFSSTLEFGIAALPGLPPSLAILLDSTARLLPTMIALSWLFRRPSHAARVMGFLRPLEGRMILGVFALLMILDHGLYMAFGQETCSEPGGGLSLADSGVWGLVYALVSACILAPFAEETLYRGILFRAFWNRVGVVPAAVLSSLVFAVLHFYDGYGLASVGLFGFACALLYASTGSLKAVITLHMLYNATIKVPEWITYHMRL